MVTLPAWKKKEVNKLSNLLKTSPIVGVVDIEGIPAFQMQEMREKLRGAVNITVSRNTLIERAIDEVKEERDDFEELKDYLGGQTALVTTDINPFKLYKRMEATKSDAPAKGGEVADKDIVVEKGNTPFKPGPIVGDLQKAGIPASIQSGKVKINKTKKVVKEGEIIPQDLARMLTRLEIKPITVGLDLKIAYEDGMFFDQDVLDIDTDEYVEKIKRCALSAFNLSVNAAYPTKQNIEILISKASRDALSLAFNSDLTIDEKTTELKIKQAYSHMLGLASKLDSEALDEELLELTGKEDKK